MFYTMSLSALEKQAMAFLLAVLTPGIALAMIMGTICAFAGLLPLAFYLPFDVLAIFSLRWAYRNGGFR